jgi:hypothetical protein
MIEDALDLIADLHRPHLQVLGYALNAGQESVVGGEYVASAPLL